MGDGIQGPVAQVGSGSPRGRWRTTRAVLWAFVPFLLLVGVSGCTEEGSAVNGQTPYCVAQWRLADGRTDRGRVLGTGTAPGGTIFAGDGFAFSSAAPLHWRVWCFGALGVGGLGVLIGAGVLHRLDVKRRRTGR
ncbi:hypothetical protein N8J89_17360 [Crossiella sp. CA-258035]|uniref:hypothetical protein n=1 Tax=Crossiella sp. CA-258035 TaxID=2981138 RepID=UPI0024BC0F44|nr:hypothetical protein [Crossiella sp. CA-258035]WHT22763.1 hypothetical protein N8J89_17360 [Crossiella sp. CA-258035]